MSPKLVCGGGGGATLLSPVTLIVVVTVDVPGGTTAVLAETEAATEIPTRNGACAVRPGMGPPSAPRSDTRRLYAPTPSPVESTAGRVTVIGPSPGLSA